MTNTERKLGIFLGSVVLMFALADLPGRTPAAPPDRTAELLEDHAHKQCAETIHFHHKRAKLGIPNTTTNAAGDVLIAQMFSVPVFGYAERVDLMGMCVLRRATGEFEFGVAEK